MNIGANLPIPAQAVRTIDTEGNLAWDRSDGEHRGRVYLVYTDSPAVSSADTDIFIRASDDNGQNWGEPIQVHDDDPLSQFLPSVAVDQSSGNVGVGWHTAIEPANVRTRFAATLSDDGGSNFRLAYAVSPGDSDATNPAIDPRGANFQYGDYTGIAFVDGVLQPIWADNSAELAANPDPPRFDLANARIAVAEVTRAPLVVETFNIEDVEGNEFTAHVATFTDPEGGGAASDYKAMIHWGDGSEDSEGTIQQQPDGSFNVLGTHQYEDFGTWSISITITGNRTRGEGTATATIENAPLDVVIPAGLRVVREMEFTKVVATLSDLNLKSTASDFIVTIEWGDGSGSLATLELQPGSGEAGAPNTFNISGTHKYLSEETFTINVSVLERASGQVLARQGELVSGDPPLIVNPGQFLDIEALAGINTGDLVLVTFERPDDIEVPLDTTVGEYTATINWGDGNVDAGITPFVTSEDVTVVGRHTYTTAGEYFPTVTLVDDSGGFFSAPLIATVELDVTSVVRAVGSGLIYNPATERFVGELTITNTSGADLPGPFFAVFHDLPEGVTLANITDVTGEEDPLAKVSVLKLQPGESLDPIPLEFDNPGRVPITYRVQVFDGVRSSPNPPASLLFEANFGQTDQQAAFVARGPNYAIFFTPGLAALSLSGVSGADSAAVHMRWLGGNESPVVVGLEPQPGTNNYFLGADPSGWITGVPNFGRVRYESVYDSIDLEYYGRDGQLEYDWIVEPGGDPARIVMQFAGADGLEIDSAGNLRLTIGDGQLFQRAPLVYQEMAGQRRDIAGEYVLRDDGTVGFAIGQYDPTLPLVIDPVLIYSTFFGPTTASSSDVAVDASGNSYITGTTVALDFPTSAGAFQEDSIDEGHIVDPFGRIYGRFDAFVVKFDPRGVPVYSTYLGGNLDDYGAAIEVDSSGTAYVTGSTQSTNFPTRSAFQTVHADAQQAADAGVSQVRYDVFLTRLSPDGSRIDYSTYLGGPGDDFANTVTIDNHGAAHVAGETRSFAFPMVNAMFGPTVSPGAGVFDAFVTKFHPSGASVELSTYLGGTGSDHAVGLVIPSPDRILVVGNTLSFDLPTRNAIFDEFKYDPDLLNQGILGYDMFLASLTVGAAEPDVLTYLGGTGGDEAFAVARDDAGNLYVGGRTWSDDLPLVAPLQSSLHGEYDGVIYKLDPDLSAILYGTYLGGSGSVYDGIFMPETIRGIAIDAEGNIIVAGESDSADLPVAAALQSELAGENDWFLASLNPAGSAINYLTYIGGTDHDFLAGLAVDRAGNAVMTGRTLEYATNDLTFDFPTYRAFDSDTNAGFFGVRMVIAKVASEPPPGFSRLEMIHRTITAVEGSTAFDGLVGSVITVDAQTAADFTASIDWGDGTTSEGTVVAGPDPGILGRRQFNVLGSHLYEDVGLYDVVVTVRDSAGKQAVAIGTAAPAHGEDHAVYRVVIDTAALAGQPGFFSVQFNPGGASAPPDADLTLSGFSAPKATLSTHVQTEGGASGELAGGATLTPTSLLNRLTQALTFGQRIELDLRISGDAIADPLLGPFGHAVAFQLLAADGVTPLLSIDPSGAVLTVAVDSDGATRSRAALSGPDASQPVAVASTSNIASVANAPLDVLLTPFSVQEGAEFSGTVATFTNENPLEALAGEHQAMIDWGDGSPATAGVITADSGHFLVTGTHRYRTAGEYPFHVTVTEPDGASVSGSESIAGNHFEASLLASIGALFAPVVADFNDDGELDVAVGQSNLGANKAFITFGGVDFTFAPTQVVDIPTRFQAAAAGDFDNDDIVDLVVAGQIDVPGTESLSVVFGSRDGSLRVASSTTPLSPYPPGSIATLDFDSDGNLDVVVGYGCGTLGCGAFVEVFRGLGDGAFERAGIHTAFLGSIVATGDLNGDGHPDIVVGSPLNISLLILLGDGAGFSGPPRSVPLPGTTNSLAIADMNEDGVLDIVVGVGHLVVLTGAGDGTFTSVSHPAATTIYRIAVVDLNGDGRPDVVASDIDTTITVLLAEADGGFVTAQTMIGSQAREVLIGDFNRDGRFDVAIVGNSAVLRIYPGRGDGMVNVAETIPSPTLQRDVLAADVNHDGFLDAVSVANGIGIGGILVSLGRGDGTFDTAPQLPLGTRATDPKPSAVAIADLNGDGRTEVLVGVPGGLAVFARNTDGSYAQSRVYPLTQSPFDMATGDLNGDGRTDIVAAISLGDFVPGNVAILLNAGDGTFAAAQYLTTGEEAGSLVLRDLNMDGSVDIAVEVQIS